MKAGLFIKVNAGEKGEKRLSSCLIVIAALATLGAWSAAAADISLDGTDNPASPLPRYRLNVGDMLVYESLMDFSGRESAEGTRDTVWVVARNDDGSSHLIVRHEFWLELPAAEGKAEPERESLDETLAYLDLHPDGTVKRNPSFGYRFDPQTVFPRLPRDNVGATNHWQSPPDLYGDAYEYAMRERPETPDGTWRFRGERKGSTKELYEASETVDVQFDGQAGHVTQVDRKSAQGGKFKSEGQGVLKLVSAEKADSEWLGKFRAEADRCFKASEEFRNLQKQAKHDFAHAEERMASAFAVLKQLQNDTTLEEVKSHVDAMLKTEERYSEYMLEHAKKFEALIGQPSDDWTLKDLDGNEHALADCRGQVVVLDFWYRGCGWCVRAMPQVMQVAARFAGQPVTVFGMNTDRELEDAKFVEQAMSLNYPSLQATGIPEKYEVNGFPTLVILDQEGRIRDFHIGYAEDLFEQVSASIEKLLEESDRGARNENNKE